MEFSHFKNKHPGSKFLVIGCGESAPLASSVKDCIVIGVNDIGRLLTPDYLLVVNDKYAFSQDRWQWIEKTGVQYVFSHLPNMQVSNEKLVIFKLGRYRQVNLDRESIDYSNNSPYMAIILAYYMGASKIGLLGVDFTNDHFFAKTGRHPLSSRLPEINTEYRKLMAALHGKNIPIFNLSPNSLLTSIPKCDTGSF